MGSVGTPELIVIFVVALIVLGPERLPQIARQLGKAMGEFRRMSAGFQDEVRKAIDDPAEYTPSFPSMNRGSGSSPADGNGSAPTAPAAPVAQGDADLPPPRDDPSRN